MNQQLQDYISRARTIGMNDEKIRQGLQEAGWNDREINVALLPATSKRKWYYLGIVFAVMVILLGLYRVSSPTPIKLFVCSVTSPLSAFVFGGSAEEKRVSCILDQATKKQDADLCQRISHAELKEYCYNTVIQQIHEYSEPVENIKTCDTVAPSGKKYVCIISTAAKKHNIEYCRPLPTTNLKDLCILEVVMDTNDISSCPLLVQESMRNTCYRHIARAINNATLCQKITTQTGKDSCYNSVAMEQHNPQICSFIQSEAKVPYTEKSLRDACYQQEAKERKDCDQIAEEKLKWGCYDNIAEKKKDITICDNIPLDAGRIRDNCYFHYQYNNKDFSHCDKISDEVMKKGCLISQQDTTSK